MTFSLFLWARAKRQLPLVALTLCTILSLLPGMAEASHIRAGDIQARIDTTGVNPRRVFFKLTLYTDISGATPVVQDDVTIFFGDGTAQQGIRRTTANAIPIPSATDTGLNTYLFEHTFPSSGSFTISFIGENRNRGIRNMDDSDNQSFYISTTITIDPLLGRNHSPVLNAPAIDKAGISQVFLHNPAGSDADGDSLAYKLRTCQQVPLGIVGTLNPPGNNRPAPITCTNYRYPNDNRIAGATNPVQVAYTGIPTGVAGDAAIFVQDTTTGQITWNAPLLAGFYNIAFTVEEWRRTSSGAFKIGEVIRDMQIIVRPTLNLRPNITVPADICVVAGQRVQGTVTAVDGTGPSGQGPTPITLFAYGGMLPPATFTQTQSGPPLASATFNWTPDCSDIANLPHQVVFKAQDAPTSSTDPILIDERVWRITVVGPPPQNVQTTPRVVSGVNTTLLTWDRYLCQNASNLYIYRKEGNGFVPGPCETGIPANSGYVRIGTVTPATMSFIDTNPDASGVARGLERGKTYCYRIYADFPLPAGGESIASLDACISFNGRSSVLTNVDVNQTSTTGQITVRWTQPKSGTSAPFTAPLGYRLSRSSSAAPTVFVPVRTFNSLADTVLTDTGLDTQDLQYTYKLEFFSASPVGGGEVVETSPTASSIRTSAVPNGLSKSIAVSWTYQVPWDNTGQPAVIFRRGPGSSTFTRIGTAATTATGGTYLDSDASLQKLETYCYYVQTEGRYASIAYLSSLINKSQERCAVLTDVPCDPVLTLVPTNCDSLASLQEFPTSALRYTNRLSWVLGTAPAGCKAEASYYRLFYRPGPDGTYTLIDSTSQTTYTHRNLGFSGGCYRVQAVDINGVRSGLSNEACQDNCVFFVLPNIFTPNGDGKNDVFRPKNSSPLRRVHFRAFNRWGVKVFENTTTAETFINWDGGGPAGEVGNSGSTKVVDGVYFYQAEVEFADNNNTKRTYKGWVEVIR